MNIARYYHAATLLPSGNVLVAGGFAPGTNVLASAELFDEATASWSPAASLETVRAWHTMTLLPSGKVLAAGGYSQATAELYDPSTNSWMPAGALSGPRDNHTATLLPNGKVLVVGGADGVDILASAELYDPSANSWMPAGALTTARTSHTATLLPNGKVLVVGGTLPSPTFKVIPDATASTEIYDPSTDIWTPSSPLATTRYLHTSTLLPNGKVLVVGGNSGGDTAMWLASAELYDPVANVWLPVAPLHTIREEHTATLLPSGKVLVVGGLGPSSPAQSAELYDPVANRWMLTAPSTERYEHTVTLLPSGKVLAVGGVGGGGKAFLVLASAELYTSPP